MDGLELCDRLRPLRDAAADNAYMLGDERERGMYDGYGEVMCRCLELPEADVEGREPRIMPVLRRHRASRVRP